MKPYKFLLTILLIFFSQLSQAGWSDFFSDVKDNVKDSIINKTGDNTVSSVVNVGLSQDAIVEGLKEALNKGVEKSVVQLGQVGGFLTDSSVKILMPESLQKVDKGLRKIGQHKIADEFINTMNHAAEKAVPETLDILLQALKAMTLKDAVNILKGEPDAATQYFKRNSLSSLREIIKPVVQKATDSVGLTSAYKQMMNKAGFLARFVDEDSIDVDGYITNKAIDGLFIKIALEEKNIRNNPLARTSDILKQVFSN